MNIFKILKNCIGKTTLSTLGAVGLSAAVGLGGVGAWMYLDSSSDDANTSFNIAQPAPEVVYVAGGNGMEYGTGGQVRSSISATTSKTFELQQRDAALAAEQKRAARSSNSYASESSDFGDPTVELRAYQMGGSEGLGTGQNESAEHILKSQQALKDAEAQLAGFSDVAKQANQQAQQNVAAQQGALASASRNWNNKPADMARAGGTAITSTYAAGSGGGSASETGSQGRISSSRAMQQLEGLKVYDNKSGKATFGGDREGEIIGGSVTSRESKEMEDIRKRSTDIASNKDRAANEGSLAFLASAKNSGGIQLQEGENVSTGTGATSKDFNNPTMNSLGALNSAIADQNLEELERDKARKRVKKWAILSLVSVIALSGLGLGSALSFIPINKLDTYAKRFETAYPDSVPGRKGRELVNILRRIVWLSMIPIIGAILALIQLLRKIGTIRRIWKDWFGKNSLPSSEEKKAAESDSEDDN